MRLRTALGFTAAGNTKPEHRFGYAIRGMTDNITFGGKVVRRYSERPGLR